MIYEMYDYRDESTRPKTLPKGCEAFIFHAKEWATERDSPDMWKLCLRRWPAQEQRPTAYGLLTNEEKDELKIAHEAHRVELYDGIWKERHPCTTAFNDNLTYRVRPEPTVEITVKVNGKPVDPCTLSAESWAALRKND